MAIAARTNAARVTRRRFGRHLRLARGEMRAIMRVQAGGDSCRPGQGLGRPRRLVQLDVDGRQRDVRHHDRRIQATCLVQRARRFDPHVAMHVGERLVVIALGLG